MNFLEIIGFGSVFLIGIAAVAYLVGLIQISVERDEEE